MISVVGGAGFIGTRLCCSLSEKSKNFEILDSKPSRRFEKQFKLTDIRNFEQIRRDLTGRAIVHLAAVHRDDVHPKSLYDEINVDGTRNICAIAEEKEINKIIFASSVAVYGFAAPDTDENGAIAPFNDYGRTKYEAECILRAWRDRDPKNRTLVIVRPTVVFGEGNRGNVYQLFRQIQAGTFVMIGSGTNRKSMAYVGNVAAFFERVIELENGLHIFNYVDKPDLDMNELVNLVREELKKKNGVGIRLPLWTGRAIGSFADAAAALIQRPLPVSSIRVRKFTATTTFQSAAADVPGFSTPYILADGLRRTLRSEFTSAKPVAEIFDTE
jgi:GlcNAc-P-P-Und epimerase